MMTTLDRRYGERARIPCRIPVELTDERQTTAFEADAVDLSVGGLSLRAERLPEVGKHLYCSFESIPGGAQVLGRGEVVWTHKSDEGWGEFGLRFIEVDPKAQALIDEMVAERIARIEPPFSSNSPVSANLELEDVEAPINATMVRSADGEALFEQPLDLLAIGRSVVARAGVSSVRGSIARVDLRMDGGTPMLALTVQLKQPEIEFGEFDWDADESPDTQPDSLALDPEAEADESESDQDSDLDSDDDEDEAVDAASDLDVDAQEESDDADSAEGAEPEYEPTSQVAAQAAPGPLTRPRTFDQMSLVFRHEPDPDAAREQEQDSQCLHLDLDADGFSASSPRYGLRLSDEDREDYIDPAHAAVIESEDWAHPPPEFTDRSWLVQTLRVFAAVLAAVQRVWQPLKRLVRGLPSAARQRLATGTRHVLAQARPRRTTARVASVARARERRAAVRVVGLGVMSIAAVALFVYALAPVKRDDLVLHRALESQAAATDPALAVTSEPSARELFVAAADDANAQSPTGAAERPTQASSLRPTTGVRTGAPGANARSVASPGGAAAVSSADAKPASNKPVVGTVFGQKQIANAKRFVLRMNSPVKVLEGRSDLRGFHVVIPGSLAHERAAPIAAAHVGVARAAIINRGNRSELDVRFADGSHPAYRVSAQGATLEILIGR